MSKSMWIDALVTKPVNEHPQRPVKVLLWPKNEDAPLWGNWDGLAEVWKVDHHTKILYYAANEVEYFAYITNPYK